MKLFKVEIKFTQPRHGRIGAEVIVHARSKPAAEKHVAARFTKCSIEKVIALDSRTSKHFVIADVVDD